jgi:hypothetical protein
VPLEYIVITSKILPETRYDPSRYSPPDFDLCVSCRSGIVPSARAGCFCIAASCARGALGSDGGTDYPGDPDRAAIVNHGSCYANHDPSPD